MRTARGLIVAARVRPDVTDRSTFSPAVSLLALAVATATAVAVWYVTGPDVRTTLAPFAWVFTAITVGFFALVLG